jgi:hypothetical protein
VKHQLIASTNKIRSFEKRPVNPSIIIRCHRSDQPAWFTVTTIEIDSQPGGGTARGGVENMRRQPAHNGSPFPIFPVLRLDEECQLNIEEANKFDQDPSVISSRDLPRKQLLKRQ